MSKYPKDHSDSSAPVDSRCFIIAIAAIGPAARPAKIIPAVAAIFLLCEDVLVITNTLSLINRNLDLALVGRVREIAFLAHSINRIS